MAKQKLEPINMWHISTGEFNILTADMSQIKSRTPNATIDPISYTATGIKGTLSGFSTSKDWIESREQGADIIMLIDKVGFYRVVLFIPQNNYIQLAPLKAKEKPSYDFSSAFIIMSMTKGNKDLDDIRDSIAESVEDAAKSLGMSKVTCKRVDDRKGATYKIDEEIFHFLESSGLIICDLTEEKPNCYFELAWAMSHKRNIIVTAKEGTKIHFDVSRFTIRFWESHRELKQFVKEDAIAIYTEHRFGKR